MCCLFLDQDSLVEEILYLNGISLKDKERKKSKRKKKKKILGCTVGQQPIQVTVLPCQLIICDGVFHYIKNGLCLLLAFQEGSGNTGCRIHFLTTDILLLGIYDYLQIKITKANV